MKILFFLVVVLFIVGNASAMEVPQSATNCHCFQERAFEQQKKFAADTYLLTTSFNSFIAANFHISKRQIVMMKMQGGVHPDDLLIGLYVSRAGKVDLNSLLAILKNDGTWKQVMESGSVQHSPDTDRTFNVIAAAGDDKTEAVEAVTDRLLEEFFGSTAPDIMGLRQEGAKGREMTLVYLLEKYAKPQTAAVDILRMYTRQQKSWGEIAHSFGLTPKETGKLISQD
jgi:hypothetical protein